MGGDKPASGPVGEGLVAEEAASEFAAAPAEVEGRVVLVGPPPDPRTMEGKIRLLPPSWRQDFELGVGILRWMDLSEEKIIARSSGDIYALGARYRDTVGANQALLAEFRRADPDLSLESLQDFMRAELTPGDANSIIVQTQQRLGAVKPASA